MKKTIIYISIIFLIAGCSLSDKESRLPQKQELNYNALYYYSMAETALKIQDYNSAIGLLRKAESHAPESIEIKERLIETLAMQSHFDQSLHNEIVNIGEQCITSENCTTRILIHLAESYSFLGNFKLGDKYLKKALDEDPSMNLYLSYYLFRKEQMSADEPFYLEQALETEWKDLRTVMMVADVYMKTDQDKALEILEKAYDLWPDEIVLRSILSIYEQRDENQIIIQKIQQHIDSRNVTSEFLKSHLISLNFRLRNFQAIVDNQDICLELDKDPALRYLFFSALTIGETEVAMNTAELIETKNDLPDNVRPLFFAYYGYVLFIKEAYSRSAENFLRSSDINLVLDIIADYGMMKDVNEDNLDSFSRSLLNNSSQIDMADFLGGYLYALLGNNFKSEELLLKVSKDYLKENHLLETTSILLLDLNSKNLDKVEELLLYREEQEPSFQEITGLYYYNTQQDSAAYKFFREELEQNSQPSEGTIIITSILAEKFKDLNYLMALMDKAISVYPDNSEILNLFGYSIADLSIEEKYPTALVLLTKALELDPDNTMIWDSMAWLHFRMEEYEEALSAMEKPLLKKIENSEIAYHLGEIYLKVNRRELALKYLKLAIELDNDPDSVKLSQKILLTLNN